MENSKSKINQLDSLIGLRAIAVIMVCCCHFGDALSSGHILSGLFRAFDEYGKYGVHIFFVISGFIIPFSLFKGGYSIDNYGRFLYKRLLRLHPPYLAALFITLLLMYISYKIRHLAFPEDSYSIIKSIFYLHIPGDNPVFWTLIVEAQYYLFIGVFYIFLINYRKTSYFFIMPAILIANHLTQYQYFSLQLYFTYFFIGNITYVIFTNNENKNLDIVALLLLFLFTSYYHEVAASISSIATVLIILFYKKHISNFTKNIGKISYSIYLIHFPIGIKFINFVKAKVPLEYGWLIFVLAFLITMLSSWLFYIIFEELSEKISKKIKYKKRILIPEKIDVYNTELPLPIKQ